MGNLKQSTAIVETEHILSVWMEDSNQNCISLSQITIKMYATLKNKTMVSIK